MIANPNQQMCSKCGWQFSWTGYSKCGWQFSWTGYSKCGWQFSWTGYSNKKRRAPDTATRKGEHLILDLVSPGRKPRSFPNGSAGRKKTNLRTCVGGAGELRNCATQQSSLFSACLYSHLAHFQSSQPLPHSQHRLASASRSDTKEERLLSSQQLVIFALRTC